MLKLAPLPSKGELSSTQSYGSWPHETLVRQFVFREDMNHGTEVLNEIDLILRT